MKRWLFAIVLTCLVGVVLTGCVPGDEVQQTTKVVRGDLVLSVEVSGNLETPRKVDLSFGTSGMVKEVMVKEGDRVTRGQVLAKLDVPYLEAGVAMAELELRKTIYPFYHYTHLSDMPGTWLALEEARDNLEQAQRLLEAGMIAEAQLLLEEVDQNLDEAENRSRAKAWSLPFAVKLAELQYNQAKAELDKAIISATFDGVIANIYITEGQQLSTMNYANPAICLIDPGEIKLSGAIDEIDISRVKLGQEAVITLDALPEKEVKGRVAFVSPASTIQTGVVFYKTTIALENPDEELKDGMSASAQIILEQHDDVLLIPNRAIQGSLEKPWVEVVGDKQVEQREISMGLSDGAYTEVLAGLEEGEEIILPKVSQFSLFF